VRQIAQRVGVMYLGRLVELAEADALYNGPRHPYTQALLSAAPIPDPQAARHRRRIKLSGEIPSPERDYPGCPFADRCPLVEDDCRSHAPALAGQRHCVSCFKAEAS
jgi:oligopeptide transport system ATP-binding protein